MIDQLQTNEMLDKLHQSAMCSMADIVNDILFQKKDMSCFDHKHENDFLTKCRYKLYFSNRR